MRPHHDAIKYDHTAAGWARYETQLMDLIVDKRLRKICDVGGGANPLLSFEFIETQGIEYTLLDVAETELEKAPGSYGKVVADIAAKDFDCERKYDLVFSKMLAEHVKDAAQMHRNIYSVLESKGYAVHFFPTLYALPFFVNKLVPEAAADKLLDLFNPRDRYRHEKFPAYYHWCRGPSGKQFDRFRALGYEVVEYTGLFGHAAYYRRIPVVKALSESIATYLVEHPRPSLTSYAQIVLRRP